MELFTVLLVIALIAALIYIWWLRRPAPAALASTEPPAAQPTATELDTNLNPLFDAAMTAIDLGLVILDEQLMIRYTNAQADELLSASGTSLLNQGLISVLRDYQLDALALEVLNDAETREMLVQAYPHRRALRVRISRFTSQDQVGLVLIIRDVTQLNMLERSRRDMVANVSHELRTPLASVKLLVETLQTQPPQAIAQRMLSQMAQEVDAVTQLVDELYELSQIESGRIVLQFQETPLTSILERSIERMSPQTQRKALRVETHIPSDLPPVLIDRDRVGQVLVNLLHNASKYIAEGGQIMLGARLVDSSITASLPAILGQHRPLSDLQHGSIPLPINHPAGEWMLVWISDSGIGIPSQDLPRIFERFYKVDRARSRDAGGTGLGLAIAKHLIEGHGGRIWATSREGSGSTFFFTLPIDRREPSVI